MRASNRRTLGVGVGLVGDETEASGDAVASHDDGIDDGAVGGKVERELVVAAFGLSE